MRSEDSCDFRPLVPVSLHDPGRLAALQAPHVGGSLAPLPALLSCNLGQQLVRICQLIVGELLIAEGCGKCQVCPAEEEEEQEHADSPFVALVKNYLERQAGACNADAHVKVEVLSPLPQLLAHLHVPSARSQDAAAAAWDSLEQRAAAACKVCAQHRSASVRATCMFKDHAHHCHDCLEMQRIVSLLPESCYSVHEYGLPGGDQHIVPSITSVHN